MGKTKLGQGLIKASEEATAYHKGENMSDRELDMSVATLVMGWTQVRIETSDACNYPVGIMPPTRGWIAIPRYCTDMNAAIEVAEKVNPPGKSFKLLLIRNRLPGLRYWIGSIEGHRVEADTAPRAICLAALKAVKGAS